MKKKEVQLRGHSNLFVGEESSWADLWIQVKERRTTRYFAPCLSSAENLEGEKTSLERAAELCRRDVEDEKDRQLALRKLADELSFVLTALKFFSLNPGDGRISIHDDSRPGHHCDEVYVNVPILTKERAERALALYLEGKGISAPGGFKFRWKFPRIVMRGL